MKHGLREALRKDKKEDGGEARGVVVRRRRTQALRLPETERATGRIVSVSQARKAKRAEQKKKDEGKKPNVARKPDVESVAGKKRGRDDKALEPAEPSDIRRPSKDSNPVESSFADAFSKIMAKSIGDKDPVLAKRRTVEMKEIELARKERKEAREKTRARKAARSRFSVPVEVLDRNFEKEMKRIATRGVVTLFNAVAKHQKALREDVKKDAAKAINRKSAPDGRSLSDARKDHFLSLLRDSATSTQAQLHKPITDTLPDEEDDDGW